MKKWLYVIVPAALLAVFLFFYLSFEKELEAREAKQHQQKLADEAAAKAKKDEAERVARESAKKKAEERAAEEAKKEAEKIAKWAADSDKIKSATDAANAEIDRNTKQAQELEAKLESARQAREKANREDFDLLKRVEAAKVAKRGAEMEIQRYTEQISKRANDSSMVRPPVVAAPTGGTN